MLLKKSLIFSVSALCFLLTGAVPEYLVTGNSPGRLEKMAEKELCLFYQKIYGKKLKKLPVSQAAGKSVIYLGQTDFALKNGVDGQKADSEEWILKTVGDDLIISGGAPAGTLYGVYEVLERLGVVFAAFDETFVPVTKPDFPRFNEKRKPAFPGRLIHDGIPYQLTRTNVHKKRGNDYALWVLRNRINGEQIQAVPSYYKGKMFNVPHYPYHNLFDYISRDLYAKHPEYFQMDAMGRRRQPREHRYRGGVCMSNPDVRRIFLESLREKIRTDRKKFQREEWPCVYDISRLDDTPFHCFCEPCKAISAREGSGTEEGLLYDFINHIAREIRKEYPEIIIRTFAEKRAPQKIVLEKNVLIWTDDLFSRHSPFVPTENPHSKLVREYRKGWFNISDNMLMWDYWNLGGSYYFAPPRVETIFDTIKPDLKYFHKNNIKSMFIEAGIDPSSPQNFILVNYFVAMHLMVDLNADENKLADKFMDAYYGKAAPVMKKYFKQIRSGVLNQPQPYATSCGAAHWRYLTPEFMVGLYQDFHKAAKFAGGRYAARVKQELVSPVWYTLVNWLSYNRAFEKIGITREKLIAECRELSRNYVETFGPYGKWHKDNFEKRFRNVSLNLPRPEKFKNVPERNFRMLSFADFKNVGMFNAKVVDDPESEMGKALKSADPRPEMHGINKMIDPKHRFYSTQFVLGNQRGSLVQVFLKQVHQDEKYHWYRIPGSIELRPVASFWGQSWAIQASANRLFLLTTGDPRDNTWEQVWFSAKFTGPAYVPGSKKKNAIYVDMMVITRGEKDQEFVPVPQYAQLTGKNKTGDLPAGWKTVKYYRSSGKTELIQKEGKTALRITGDPGKITAISGPEFACGPQDVVKIRVRTTGKKCRVGLYRYGVKTYLRGNFVPAPDSGMQNEFIFDISDLPKAKENARCALALELLPGGKVCDVDQLEVTVARNLNQVKTSHGK